MNNDQLEKGSSATTLFFMGPQIRDWGHNEQYLKG
jgi:hypothetical protein